MHVYLIHGSSVLIIWALKHWTHFVLYTLGNSHDGKDGMLTYVTISLAKYLAFTFSKVTLHRNPHMSCKLVSFSRVAVYYLGLKIVHGSLWNVFMAKRWNEQWQHFKHSWARFKTYWVGQVMHKYLFRILGRDLSLPLLELVSPLNMQSSLTSRSSAAAAHPVCAVYTHRSSSSQSWNWKITTEL